MNLKIKKTINPLVVVSILNWNGVDDTIECLSSIGKNDYPKYKVIVLDNGSKNDEAKVIKKLFPKFTVIRSGKNLGFAEGNNFVRKIASKKYQFKYFVTLNNDTVVDKKWLTKLVNTMENDYSLGSAQSKILFKHNRSLINNAGICISKDGSAFNRKIGEKDNIAKNEEIFGPCAASAIYREKAIKKVKFFDKDFFCYMEDVDLSWRLRLSGWKSMLVFDSKVYHVHSASSPSSEFKISLINRNSVFVLIKNYPFKWILSYPLNHFKMIFFSLRSNRKSLKNFKGNISTIKLIYIKILSYLKVINYLPRLISKRRGIRKNVTVSNKDISDWFKIFSIQ